MPPRVSTARSSACWRSATRPMWSSAPSARRSTSGSRHSAESASADRVDCDLDFAEPAATWIGATLKALAPAVAPDAKVIAVDFGAKAAPNLDVVEAEVTETINLNSSRSARRPIHLELTFEAPRRPTSRATRSISMPRTIRHYVDALLRRRGLSPRRRCARSSSRAATSRRSRSRRWRPTPSFGQRYVKELVEAGTAKNWIAGRQLIDLVQQFPIALDAEKLRALTRPLRPAPTRLRHRAARSARKRIC